MKKRLRTLLLAASLCGACVINNAHSTESPDLQQELKQPGHYPLLSAGVIRITKLPENPTECSVLSLRQYFVDNAMKKYDTETRETLIANFFIMNNRFEDLMHYDPAARPLNDVLNHYLEASRISTWHKAVGHSNTQVAELVHQYEVAEWIKEWELDLDDLECSQK